MTVDEAMANVAEYYDEGEAPAVLAAEVTRLRGENARSFEDLKRAMVRALDAQGESKWFRRREAFVRELSQAVAQVLTGFPDAAERGRRAGAFLAPAFDAFLDFEGDEPRPGFDE